MLLHDLQAASFRGVPFLVPKDQAEEGRNSIPHDYPGSGNRYIEDNGYTPPVFSLSCVLHGQGLPGKFSRLRRALNTPGPGTLHHPYYGRHFCQVLGPFTVSREDTDSGVIVIEVKFGVTNAPIFPSVVSGLASVVSGLASSLVTQIFAAFQSRWGAPASTVTRETVAVAIADAGRSLDAPLGGASPAARRLTTEPHRFAVDGRALAEHLVSACRDPFDDLSISNDTLASGFQSVLRQSADLRLTASGISPSTRDLVLRKATLEDLANTTAAAAFACLAEAMAARTYHTADAVAADEWSLGTYFGRIQAMPLDAETVAGLTRVFLETSEVLQRQEVRLPHVTEINVVAYPASVLAYELYDDPARAPRLIELNPGANPTLFDGRVRVLEAIT